METRKLPLPDRLFWVRDNDSYWTHPEQKWLLDWIQYGKDTHAANQAFGPAGQSAAPIFNTGRAEATPPRDVTLDDSVPPEHPWLNGPLRR